MWPRRTLPEAEFGLVTARLETVIRRNGFVVEPVLWQIVTFAGGVALGAGVAEAAGHAPVPTTIASPVCSKCARRTLPTLDVGLVIARLEIVMRRNELLVEPVLWQIVSFAGAAPVPADACSPAATAISAAIPSDARNSVDFNRRFIYSTPSNDC